MFDLLHSYCILSLLSTATLPESSTTAVIGTTVKECPPGQEVTGVLCKMCPKESYKKGTNSDQCKPCPDDENGRSGYTSTVGSSRCLYVSSVKKELDFIINIYFAQNICSI